MHVRDLSRKALLIAAAVIFAPMTLHAAKAVPVTVTGANPSAAIQGQELDVIVSGTGFGNGSTVKYLVTGTTDASQVTVLSVAYDQQTGQLKTHIKVNGEALVTSYDIQVITSTGRKGKGTTLFKVNLDPSVILPVSLGAPAGCDTSLAFRLNDGVYLAGLIVVGDTYGCTTGKDRPYRWQNGAWQDLGTLGSATSGVTEGVSNDGTVVGWVNSSTGINSAFVSRGGTMSPLPLLAGMVHSNANGINQKDGTHIFGKSSIEGEHNAVRWSRDAGGAWSVEAIGAQGPGFRQALGSSDDGSVLVGSEWVQTSPSVIYGGWVWVEGSSPAWVSLGAGTEAFDIDPAATMIVGYRTASCGSSCTVSVPVYWTLDGFGNWASHDLTPLDSAYSSWAQGVGSVNGKLVIVGYANAKLTQQAVAWLPQTPGIYGAPLRLAAIDGNSSAGAQARDVNANGVVAGWSSVPQSQGGGRRAVLWMLPATW